MASPTLGVCYYPEQWPEALWAEDARRMAELGITRVRIGEFAWSRIEPSPGTLSLGWLDRAIDTLAAAGLQVVLGTPTATPPKWLVDRMPDMLPVDGDGRQRRFGSRRHYCFSHLGYREECARIVTVLAERYGHHPAVFAWQIDNEYGCHDTTLSYSTAARDGFRRWLAARYASIDALNRTWQTVFWSKEYRSFDEIDLPYLTVTEAHPAHRLDFQRFASDQVVAFNQVQADILRRLAPGRDLIHNFMGRVFDFDQFEVADALDIASWDSYPLGFLEDRVNADDGWRRRFARVGDPDFQAFHHDLYRAAGRGRWWVMEQQPGPVNWAPHNPVPRDGMIRLWTWEAFAHGAETVSYFRWRQMPAGQEQMHAGLRRPDDRPSPAMAEVAQTVREIANLGNLTTDRTEVAADVALVFDHTSSWAWSIQSQGAEFDYFRLLFDAYRGVRRRGLSVEMVSSRSPGFDGHRLVLIPGLFAWNDNLRKAIAGFDGTVLIGPRSGSKTRDFAIPDQLPPDLGALLEARIGQVESLAVGCEVAVDGGGAFQFWREYLETVPPAETCLAAADGVAAPIRQGGLFYLAGWPDPVLLDRVLSMVSEAAGVALRAPLPDGLCLRRAGDLLFAFNYGGEPVSLDGLGLRGPYLLGGAELGPSDVAAIAVPASPAEPA